MEQSVALGFVCIECVPHQSPLPLVEALSHSVRSIEAQRWPRFALHLLSMSPILGVVLLKSYAVSFGAPILRHCSPPFRSKHSDRTYLALDLDLSSIRRVHQSLASAAIAGSGIGRVESEPAVGAQQPSSLINQHFSRTFQSTIGSLVLNDLWKVFKNFSEFSPESSKITSHLIGINFNRKISFTFNLIEE